MSSSVRTIKLTIFLSILFAFLTYLVTVNMELNVVSCNTGWISNNFFLTVFGGAFGSTVVVLICEVQKYWILKKDTEIRIYNTLYSIFAEIIVSTNTARTYLQNTELTVHEGILDANRERAFAAINILETFDYRPFFKKNDYWSALACFSQEAYQRVKQLVSDEQFLNQAVLMDKIELMQKRSPDAVTAKCTNTRNTLEILLRTGERCANDMKILFDRLETIQNGRLKWAETKERIESFQKVLGLNEYEKFIVRGAASAEEESL